MRFYSKRSWSVVATALFLGLTVPAFALSGDLQGLHRRNSTNWNTQSPWTGNNLRGWRELDLVPCRVVLRGPAEDTPVSIVFPRTRNGNPAIENLFFISNSPNVTITQPPALTTLADVDQSSYKFNVSITGTGPGYVYFYARLALGAFVNPGGSLHIWGTPSLGQLQFHKVKVAPVKPDLAVAITGPGVAIPGETFLYTVEYANLALLTNDTAHAVTISAQLPASVNYVPGSASSGGSIAGNTLTWNLPELQNQALSSVSYRVVVSESALPGQILTNAASIAGAESDVNPADNLSTALTHIAARNPTNSGTLLITRIIKVDERVYHVFFLTKSDRNYVLQYTEDFVEWTTDPLVIPGTGNEVFSRQDEGGAMRFYRVMELP